MEMTDNNLSLTSEIRIQKLIEESNNELNKIQPEIDYLESCVIKLEELRLKKDKLLSLQGSLKAILNSSDVNLNNFSNMDKHAKNHLKTNIMSSETNTNLTEQNLTLTKDFFKPEIALELVKRYLRPDNNLNYEIFKAIAYNGGEATTEQIKDYLVKNKIKQPKTGKFFDNVELKDISSRVNYLTRKNLVVSVGPGRFKIFINH